MMSEVHPSPHSSPPRRNFASAAVGDLRRSKLTLSTSAQIVASLQGALEVDAASTARLHPWVSCEVSSDEQQQQALDANRSQAELFTVFKKSLDQDFIRMAEPAPHNEERQVLRDLPVVPRPRNFWRVRSIELSKLVRATLPEKIRRFSTSMVGTNRRENRPRAMSQL